MAVRAIRNPWEQQRMLKVLAPQLPATLLREALSMTRAIGDESWRARALVGMVASLPESQRHDAMLEALAAARAIPDRASRVLTLARFMLYLPEQLKSNMEQEMLTLTRALENKSKQCQVFAALLPYLTTPLKQVVVQETLNLTRSLHIPERWAGLLRLSPYLEEPSRSKVLREALTGISRIRNDMDEQEVQEQVRSAWEAIEQTQKRKDTVAGLIPPTPQPLTEEQLPGALAVARIIEESPQEALPYFLLFSVEGGTELRAEALVGLVPHLEKLPHATLHRLWHETLPPLASRTRKDLLADIRTLAPIIAALGGSEGVLETFRAIQDVGRWWP